MVCRPRMANIGKAHFCFAFCFILYHTGGDYGEATPVPIPNTVVKLSSADNTWLVTTWEDRSLPVYFIPQ